MTIAPPDAPPRSRRASSNPRSRRLDVLVLVLCLLPLARLGWDAATGGLGAEPVEALVRRTGWWALTFLLLSLSITPLRRLARWNAIVRHRRTLGLVAFGYACLHLTMYVAVDQWFGFAYIVEDILERPFITAGFLAFLLLVPLAATSTRDSIRRLGGRRWQRLHTLVYPAAAIAVLHYFWLVKADTSGPLTFAAILMVLLIARIPLRSTSPRASDRTIPSPGATGPGAR